MNVFCKAYVTLSNWLLSSALALILLLLFLLLNPAPALAQADDSDKKAAEITVSEVVLRDIPFEASVSGIGDRLADGAAVVLMGGAQRYSTTVADGSVTFDEVVVTSDPADLLLLGPNEELIAQTQVNTLAGHRSCRHCLPSCSHWQRAR